MFIWYHPGFHQVRFFSRANKKLFACLYEHQVTAGIYEKLRNINRQGDDSEEATNPKANFLSLGVLDSGILKGV